MHLCWLDPAAMFTLEFWSAKAERTLRFVALDDVSRLQASRNLLKRRLEAAVSAWMGMQLRKLPCGVVLCTCSRHYVPPLRISTSCASTGRVPMGFGRVQVRYTAVRRQTASKQGEHEVQVLDYQNTAFELLPLLATAYALVFMVRSLHGADLHCVSLQDCRQHVIPLLKHVTCGFFCSCASLLRLQQIHPALQPSDDPSMCMLSQGQAGMRMYHDFEENRSRGDFSTLPELHATLSGMKVLQLKHGACCSGRQSFHGSVCNSMPALHCMLEHMPCAEGS